MILTYLQNSDSKSGSDPIRYINEDMNSFIVLGVYYHLKVQQYLNFGWIVTGLCRV